MASSFLPLFAPYFAFVVVLVLSSFVVGCLIRPEMSRPGDAGPPRFGSRPRTDPGTLQTADEVNEARKDLQRQGILRQYRDEDNQNLDVIPGEVAETLRREYVGHEL